MTEEKPLTRDDVLKLIEEHGGPEGLDLSGRNLEGIDLSSDFDGPRLDLRGIILKHANLQDADLDCANLEGAIYFGANLRGARFWDANLRGADLWHAELEGSYLWHAKLQGAQLQWAWLSKARLFAVLISAETMFDNVDWGPNYILGDEADGEFRAAMDVYRRLKQWHTQAGMYDIAARFYYREMEARRKSQSCRKQPHLKLWSWAMRVLCGYGEKPERVVASALVVVFGLALLYSASALTFLSSLYHSAVSFTALGYGLGVSNVDGWVKAVGAAEAFMGVFMMALFLITFVRKMTR